MAILIISLISLIILFLFWIFFIRPLFKYRAKTSHMIREAVFPQIITIDSTIITIASASIVLTVNFVDKINLDKEYLAISWIGFISCIVLGVFILIGHYTHRLSDKILMNEFEGFAKLCKNEEIEQIKIEEERSNVRKILKDQTFLFESLLILIIIQVVSFYCSMCSLVIFGIKNLK